MGWGDVPAWVAIGISLVAGGRAWVSERRAREAAQSVDSVETSMRRMADSMVAMQEAQERRWRRRPTESALLLAQAPTFSLEFETGHAYRLRNVGTARATGVTVQPEGLPVAKRLPAGVDLEIGASTESFVLQGASGAPLPGEIRVACDELPDVAVVRIPPGGRSGWVW